VYPSRIIRTAISENDLGSFMKVSGVGCWENWEPEEILLMDYEVCMDLWGRLASLGWRCAGHAA
jgi:hypothetical protein